MNIGLHTILPSPLAERPGKSELWGKPITLTPGGIVLFHAPSAGGKTTLISMIYGLRGDYEGDITLGEKNISSLSAPEWAALRQRHLSIVFQDMRLFPGLTGMENILVKARLTGTIDDSGIRDMAGRLDVGGVLDRAAGTLSRGECQRIAILRALVQPFDWLLLDEPFSHLDRGNARRAAGLIKEECGKRSAGLIMADLDDDEGWFPYDMKVRI
ncbi:MAG: ATP-binding cassette domain-containing protein [Spirochaetales bacterium]|nr:ATP-binding cassette domain-containing protein [Spirochaetales bacterium]